MKYKFVLLLSVTLLLQSFIPSTHNFSTLKETEQITIAFYNTENFFDTIDDTLIDDSEFLPGSKNDWTEERYQLKVNHLAKVISSLNDSKGPDVIGLAEVENQKVLEDLIADPQLDSFHYGIVHYDSPDARGIDVALLYKKAKFTVLESKTFPIHIDSVPDFKTRDILMVKGIAADDTVYIFVNHWPSRRGGAEISQSKRIAAAEVLKKQTDEIFGKNKEAQIIILGDLNDNPDDVSISTALGAFSKPKKSDAPYLFNAAAYDHQLKTGTLYYKGNWDIFDQLIISSNLAKANHTSKDGQMEAYQIFKPDWILKKNSKGEMEPFRTYQGNYYTGGYSDHLPVYAVLNLD